MKSKNIFSFIVLGILILLFFFLMIYSTGSVGVNVSYNFENEVSLSQDDVKNKRVLIGNIEIANEKYISSKVPLKRFYGCTFDDEVLHYNIEILNTQLSYRNDFDIFGGDYYYLNYFEIGPKKVQVLNMIASETPHRENIVYREEIVNLYIFELDSDERTYYYNTYDKCDSLNINNAFATIKINVE